MKTPPKTRDIKALLEVMRALRDPDGGCPWDVEQTFETIVPYTIEEAYEVAGAIEHGDMDELRDELGDLLLQVVFHSRMAEEKDIFNFNDVTDAVVSKMIRRHPHVFGDGETHEDSDAVMGMWESIKSQERAGKNKKSQDEGVLDGIPAALPALMRSEKLQKRAARVGFDWPETSQVVEKLHEELQELDQEMNHPHPDETRLEHEIGDVLFASVNLARHLGIDPETAMRKANSRFENRFGYIETALKSKGKTPSDANLNEMEELWQKAKSAEL